MTDRISASEARDMLVKPKRKHKYNAQKTTVDDIIFDSKLEAKRYTELKLLEKAGEIYELELQRPYALTVNGYLIATLRADFVYFCDKRKKTIIEDTKGMITPEFTIKKKLLKAIYGTDVEIIR